RASDFDGTSPRKANLAACAGVAPNGDSAGGKSAAEPARFVARIDATNAARNPGPTLPRYAALHAAYNQVRLARMSFAIRAADSGFRTIEGATYVELDSCLPK